MIRVVSAVQLPRDREPGFPESVAFFMDKIEFSPPPDKLYVVKVRYMPPIEEF